MQKVGFLYTRCSEKTISTLVVECDKSRPKVINVVVSKSVQRNTMKTIVLQEQGLLNWNFVCILQL